MKCYYNITLILEQGVFNGHRQPRPPHQALD